MSTVIATLLGMGSKLLTAKVIEKLSILLVGELVKRTSSEVDDKAFEIIKGALEK